MNDVPENLPGPEMNITEALTYLEAAYPAWKAMADKPVVWTDILQDVSPLALGHAVREYVRQGHEFAPSPGQILKLAQPAPPAPDPLEAWGEVCRAVRIASSEPKWSHPHIARAVRGIGGFSMLERELGEATRTSMRARFVDCMTHLPALDKGVDEYQKAIEAANTPELGLALKDLVSKKKLDIKNGSAPF